MDRWPRSTYPRPCTCPSFGPPCKGMDRGTATPYLQFYSGRLSSFAARSPMMHNSSQPTHISPDHRLYRLAKPNRRPHRGVEPDNPQPLTHHVLHHKTGRHPVAQAEDLPTPEHLTSTCAAGGWTTDCSDFHPITFYSVGTKFDRRLHRATDAADVTGLHRDVGNQWGNKIRPPELSDSFAKSIQVYVLSGRCFTPELVRLGHHANSPLARIHSMGHIVAASCAELAVGGYGSCEERPARSWAVQTIS